MIGYLSGVVHDSKQSALVVLASGIGFVVHVTARVMVSKGASIALEIYTHATQDNGMHLYGFENADERAVFLLIIGCNGLGPKIGLAVLSSLTPSLFISAILTSDIKTLSSIEGIGAKKAESMIMQLKDKAAKIKLSNTEATTSTMNVKQLSEVLGSLGYSRPEITAAMEFLNAGGYLQNAQFDEIVRKGLSFLAKKGM